MLRNYLSVLFRTFFRQRVYSFINIFGLALGLSATILILVYVQHELGYDRFHENVDRIYRVNSLINFGNNQDELGMSMGPLAPALLEHVPGIEYAVRYDDIRPGSVTVHDRSFPLDNPISVDTSFFEMFTFPLLQGSEHDALVNPNSVVLSESYAQKLFGSDDPIGREIQFAGDSYNVTGVAEDAPTNSQLNYEAIFPYESFHDEGQWMEIGILTFVMLNETASMEEVSEEMNALFGERFGIMFGQMGGSWDLYLYPFGDIHLKSNVIGDPESNSSIHYVMGFAAIAGFILLLACINFINLSTARSTKRAREVGMRKVLGAERRTIILQFLAESIAYALLGTIIALAAVYFTIEPFGALVQRDLTLEILYSPSMILSLAGMVILVGVISGSFPAFVLSRFRPTQVLKGVAGLPKRGTTMRRILVVGQFLVSITLIVSTVSIYKQLQFMQTKRLGFDKEQVVNFTFGRDTGNLDLTRLKNELLALPGVENATVSSGIPFGSTRMKIMAQPESIPEDQPFESWMMGVDHEFVPTFGMTILEGRDFNPEITTDEHSAILINEAAVRAIGWEEPVGMSIPMDGPPGPDGQMTVNEMEVIGIVQDFHFSSLREQIEPMILFYDDNMSMMLTLRLEEGTIPATMDLVEETWNRIAPDVPFEPAFLEERVNEIYHSERRFAQLISLFTILAMVVAALGLFGLASYAAESRTKEIGIRKVLGASEGSLFGLLTREFTILVAIAAVLAVPGTWYFLQRWLNTFAYHISMGLDIFLVSAVILLVIVLLSVGFQAIRAARANPVHALRYE